MTNRSATHKKPAYALTFVSITAAVFMANLDLWVATVALPTIGLAFHQPSLSNLSWVLNAYSIVLAALLIVAGRVGDRVGNRKLFLIGVAVFTIASAACAAAPSFSFLIVARIFQAAGAAAQLPASLALLMAAAKPERRHEAARMWAAVGSMAAALGPVIGGLLVQASWRWAFLINVPIGIVAFIIGRRTLPRLPTDADEPRPDIMAATVLTLGMAALTGALVQAAEWGWADRRVLLLFAVAIIAAIIFTARCLGPSVPLIEGSIVRNRLFIVSNLAILTFSIAFAILLLSATLWCQDVWHYSPLRTGLALAPSPLVVPFVAIACIKLVRRFGPVPLCVIGAIFYTLSTVWIIAVITVTPNYVSELLPGANEV